MLRTLFPLQIRDNLQTWSLGHNMQGQGHIQGLDLQGQGQGLSIRGQGQGEGQGLDLLGQEHDSRG